MPIEIVNECMLMLRKCNKFSICKYALSMYIWHRQIVYLLKDIEEKAYNFMV